MCIPEINKIYYVNLEEKANLEELHTARHIIKKLRYEFKLFVSRYHQLTSCLKDSSTQTRP